MEMIFNYDTMKHTLVLTVYMLLIMFDCYMISYMVCSFVRWVVRKIKKFVAKLRKKNENKEDSSHE